MGHLEMLKGLPVHANLVGFANLLGSIEEAEEQGLKFGGEVPDADIILDEA